MDARAPTPLLDFFRRGDVARDVRMLAAQGAIAPRPLEQLGLLMVLISDHDSGIRDTAEATLAGIPIDLLAGFMARSDVPAELREFLARRGVIPAATPLNDRETPAFDRDDSDDAPPPADEEGNASALQRLAAMSVPEKVRAAMKGTREMRALLVRDANKLVALAVLSSPRITDAEVEAFAKMGSVGEDVLRIIGHTRAWTKHYGILHALVKNSKTPLAVSLTLLNRVNDGDLKKLSMDRNIPESLRVAVRKRLAGR